MRNKSNQHEIDTSITLYRMLHATDTFDLMYSRLLSKRLLDVDNCMLEKEV